MKFFCRIAGAGAFGLLLSVASVGGLVATGTALAVGQQRATSEPYAGDLGIFGSR